MTSHTRVKRSFQGPRGILRRCLCKIALETLYVFGYEYDHPYSLVAASLKSKPEKRWLAPSPSVQTLEKWTL